MKWLFALLVIWLAWRLLAKPRRTSAGGAITSETEAYRVLGVAPGAGDRAIRDAHRRRIAAVHPDRGGSAELTRDLNAARDLLLDRSSR